MGSIRALPSRMDKKTDGSMDRADSVCVQAVFRLWQTTFGIGFLVFLASLRWMG